MRRISGAVPRKINAPKQHGQYCAIPLTIANKLAESSSRISSSPNFENMNEYKSMREMDRIPFKTEEELVYKKDFSESELDAALRAKDIALGRETLAIRC